MFHNTQKKSLFFFSVLIFSLLFISCGKTAKVRFLNFKPEITKYYEEVAKIYKEQTGIDVIIDTAANNSYESTLIAKMTSPEMPTLFQINGPKALEQWGEFCEDLSDSELAKHIVDESFLLHWNGNVVAIPYSIESYGIIYNKAITDKYFLLPEKSVPFNSMEEIDNFEKLKLLCEDIQKNREKLNIKGVFASTSLKHGENWRWQSHLINLPLHYEFQNGNFDLSSGKISQVNFNFDKEFKNIFDLYLTNSVIPQKASGLKTVTDSMSEFAMEHCAMVQNGNWAWEQIKGVKGNKIKEENVKFLPIYTGIEGEESQGLCIGTENYFVINSYASKHDIKATKDFIWWLFSNDEAKKIVVEKFGFITPFDTFSENEIPSDPLAKEIFRWLEKDGTIFVPWVFNVIPSEKFKVDFGDLLLQYAQGNKSWEEVKDRFVKNWKSESEN